MDVIFPFECEGKGLFGQIYRPVAKVTFTSSVIDKSVDVWMVVDTGADYSILPRHFAEKLRVSLESDCIKEKTFGVGGSSNIYFCKSKIKAKIGFFEKAVPHAFFDHNEVPALLGRLGFLETFDVEFLKKHIVVFKE